MKTNVTYLKHFYTVNKDKKTVHCKLQFGINMNKLPGIDWLNKNDEFVDFINELINIGVAKLVYDKNITYLAIDAEGIAHCAPEDEFDESLGKKIASTRAQRRSFVIAQNLYDNLYKFFMDYANSYKEIFEKSHTSAKKCTEHLNDLIESIKQ